MAGLSTLKDSFSSSATLSTLWSASYGVYGISGGVGTVQCDTSYNNSLRSNYGFSLKNDSVAFKIASLPAVAGASSDMYLSCAVTQGPSDANAIIVSINPKANQIYFRNNFADLVAPQAYNATWTRIRIREGTAAAGNLSAGTANHVYLDAATADDETHWVALGSANTPAWVTTTSDSAIDFEAHRDTGTTNNAAIDNVNLTLPGVPTGLGVTPGDGQATVAWTAPASNGGTALTDFSITITPAPAGGSPQLVGSGMSTSKVITGLTNGTSYAFTVAAVNQVGTGPATTGVSGTPVASGSAPAAPTGVTAYPGNGQASVLWTPPTGTITDYVVTASPTPPGGATRTVGSNTPSYTFTGLTNGQPYTFTVQAKNAVGTSSASTASAAVTPTGGTSTSNPKISTLVDGFDGTTVDGSKWAVSSTGGGVNEGGGSVNIVAAPGGVFNQISSLAPYDLTGDAMVLHFFGFPVAPGSVTTAVLASPTPGTDLRFTVTAPDTGNQGTIAANSYSGYTDTKTPVSFTADLTQPIWLKIYEAGGTVQWARSNDGLTWTDIGFSTPTPSWATGVSVVIGANNQNASTVTPPAGGGGTPPTTGGGAPGSGNAAVDFRTATYALDRWSVGSCVSTYNDSGQANINASQAFLAKLAALGPLAWRIPLRFNGGSPGSSAGGAQSSGDAATYIQNITNKMAGTPVIVIGGDNADNSFQPSDCGGMVSYFNGNGGQHGGPVRHWVIGNEADNPGQDPAAYIQQLGACISAMKAVDPMINISAPAAATWDPAFIRQAAAFPIETLSWHAYDGDNSPTDGAGQFGFPVTSHYGQHVADLRAIKAGLRYGLEEFNWHYDYASATNKSAFYDWRENTWVASVIGQLISNGGAAYHYADSNSNNGLLNDGTNKNGMPGSLLTEFPSYWAIAMWTGMNGQWRGLPTMSGTGHMVTSSSTVTNTEVYGADNGTLWIINKDTADHAMTIGLGGYTAGTTFSIWQTVKTQPLAKPVKLTNIAYSASVLSINAPQGTITAIAL